MRSGTQKQKVLILLMTGPCRVQTLQGTGNAGYRRCIKVLRKEGYEIKYDKEGKIYYLIGGQRSASTNFVTSLQVA